MNIGNREKILLGVLSVIALLLMGRVVWMTAISPITSRQSVHDDLASELSLKQRQLRTAQQLQAKLDAWEKQSLPADEGVARRLYQNWLLQLAQQSGLDRQQVVSGEIRREQDLFYRLPFTVRGTGSLEELTRFLHGFYSQGYLHQITRININPIKESTDLEVTISVEAAALDDAEATDSLPEAPPRWQLAELNEYSKNIVGRAIFKPYTPPRPLASQPEPRQEPPKPEFDASKYTFINGIVEVNGRREVWIKARTSGETYNLTEAESFEIGSVKGKVLHIGLRDVEVEIAGERRVLKLGENLHGKGPKAEEG